MPRENKEGQRTRRASVRQAGGVTPPETENRGGNQGGRELMEERKPQIHSGREPSTHPAAARGDPAASRPGFKLPCNSLKIGSRPAIPWKQQGVNGRVSPQREANRDRLVPQEQAEGAGGRGRGLGGGEGTRDATSPGAALTWRIPNSTSDTHAAPHVD